LAAGRAGEGGIMLALLVIIGLVVLAFIVLGFIIKWLFILAVVAALVWLIAFFAGRTRANI
jgi:hypothetical protein